MQSRAGKEIPREYRRIVNRLVDELGWRYQTGKNHPAVYPPDRGQPPLPVPTTPGDWRGLRNFKTSVRHRGGVVLASTAVGERRRVDDAANQDRNRRAAR